RRLLAWLLNAVFRHPIELKICHFFFVSQAHVDLVPAHLEDQRRTLIVAPPKPEERMDESGVVHSHFSDRFVAGPAIYGDSPRQGYPFFRPDDVKLILFDLKPFIARLPESPVSAGVTSFPTFDPKWDGVIFARFSRCAKSR